MRRWERSEGGGAARASTRFADSTAGSLVATGASTATRSREERSGVRPSWSPTSGDPEFSVSPQGESELFSGDPDGVWSGECAGWTVEIACETLSACPPRTAAATSQHGNTAVLSQNTTQAITNHGRANPRNRSARPAFPAPLLRADGAIRISLLLDPCPLLM